MIAKEDEQRFKRTVFRITKGNVWINVIDIHMQDQVLVDPLSVRSEHNYSITRTTRC